MQSKLIHTTQPLLRLVLPPTFKPSAKFLRELEGFLVCHGFKKTDRWLTPDMAAVVVEFLRMKERQKERRTFKAMKAKLEESVDEDDDDSSDDDDDSSQQ